MSVIVVCFHYCLSYGCLYLLRFQIFSQNPLEQIEPIFSQNPLEQIEPIFSQNPLEQIEPIFFLERYLGGP